MTEAKVPYELPHRDVPSDLPGLLEIAMSTLSTSTGSDTAAWFQNLTLVQIALQLEQLNRTLSQLVPPQREE